MAARVSSQQRSSGNGRPAGDESQPGIPLRFGNDPYVWACWLYYEDGLTQGEIADAMGVVQRRVYQLHRAAVERMEPEKEV